MSIMGRSSGDACLGSPITINADPDRQGEVVGANHSFPSIGGILDPFLSSLLFSLHNPRTLPFVAAMAVLCVVAALLPRATAISD